MTIPAMIEKMIVMSDGNTGDIQHFLKVWAWAKNIGEAEGLAGRALFLLEVTAIIHDISIPLCRSRYGSTAGDLQEAESAPLVRAFLADTGLETEQIERIAYVVSHHHTVEGVDGIDWRILLEADFLVNSQQQHMDTGAILAARSSFYRTGTGTRLLNAMYAL